MEGRSASGDRTPCEAIGPSERAARHTVGVQVLEATEVTDELVDAFARLIPQLSSSNPPPSRKHLAEMIDSDASVIFIAEHEGTIVGTLTLVLFRIPTGVRAWIEDVIVDELNTVQGQPMDIKGYYAPDDALAEAAMRPSATLNALVNDFAG